LESVKFIDAIKVDAGARVAEGLLFVDAGADYLKDHFPGAPMLPGLLMLEASVRTAAALWAACVPPVEGAVLEHVERLQMVRRVVPGETLRVHVELAPDPVGHRTACFTARGAVDGETAVRARFRLRAATQEVIR
jgi:3-hydroxyacyl-[acyl-carrier-protein] dehydratase